MCLCLKKGQYFRKSMTLTLPGGVSPFLNDLDQMILF